MADAPRELKAGEDLPYWRQAAGGLSRLLQAGAEGLESAPPALRPAAFLPWFLLNLQPSARALSNFEQYGMRERYSRPEEIEAGAPTLRTPAADLAQVAFSAAGVTPTAQLARGASRLPAAALNELASVGPRSGQRGAVKLPGGRFDWESFEPLKVQMKWLPGPATRQAGPTMEAWIDTAVRNYVNRYLGTARDPLKDVQVPKKTGEGTDRLEDMTDLAVTPIERRYTEAWSKDFKDPDAPVWQWGSPAIQGRTGLTFDYPFPVNYDTNKAMLASYRLEDLFGRAAAWVNQNVPREELSRWDLPRAVKGMQDAEAAAKAAEAKEVARSSLELPVVKEYPEGYRWVEHKQPSSLSKEQLTRVRRLTRDDADQFGANPGDWLALDGKGQPIMMQIPGWAAGETKPVIAHTPQKAYMSGKLVEEGNIMVGCHGRYCDDVSKGDMRVLSLRSKSGYPHVTVGIEKSANIENISTADHLVTLSGMPRKEAEKLYEQYTNYLHVEGLRRAELGFGEWFVKAAPDEARAIQARQSDRITELKGPHNRKPSAEVMPFVQDFARTMNKGKSFDLWASDFEHTDLMRTKFGHLTKPEVVDKIIKHLSDKVPEGPARESALSTIEGLRGNDTFWTEDTIRRFLETMDPTSGGGAVK